MDVQELIAREEIRDLVAAYAQLADGGRFDALLELFADDAVLEPGELPAVVGRDALRAFFAGTGRDLAAATTRPLIRHHVSNLRIALAGPDAATGACYFFVVTERGPDHWGRYRDRYARTGGRWRFQHRMVRTDGFAPGSWVAEQRRRRAGQEQ
jgi:ketosteroid isomerase-like protein